MQEFKSNIQLLTYPISHIPIYKLWQKSKCDNTQVGTNVTLGQNSYQNKAEVLTKNHFDKTPIVVNSGQIGVNSGQIVKNSNCDKTKILTTLRLGPYSNY